MTIPNQESQASVQQEQIANKEMNFRKQEQMYQRQLEQANQARLEAERRADELSRRQQPVKDDDEDDDQEPYVDKKKLQKTLSKYETKTNSEIQKAIEKAKYEAKEEIKRETWLDSNPDFNDVLHMDNINRFAQKAPNLAKAILNMPEGFERQKLVYENIKTLGCDKAEQPKSTIQEKVDANRRSPYYQPSGIGAAPYGGVGVGKDYNPTEMKTAYDQMQALKKKLRI